MGKRLPKIESEFDTPEDAAAYNAWFVQNVQAAVAEADSPNAVWLSHDQAMAHAQAAIDEGLSKKPAAREGKYDARQVA
jgi:hypothetical protein